MKLKITRFLATALLAFAIVGNAIAANPKREMRSTWLTLVSNIDWPSTKGTSASAQAAQKQELIAYLDNLEELNMTSTCLHIRTMGDAAYPSEYAPWSSYISAAAFIRWLSLISEVNNLCGTTVTTAAACGLF